MRPFHILILASLTLGACKKEKSESVEECAEPVPNAEIFCPEINGDPAGWDGAYWFDDWWAVEKVDCGTYILAEPNGSEYNVNYLISGSEKSILFDVSTGEHPIGYLVDSLANTPVTVVFSHFHYDHVGNNEEFDNVAFIDLPYLQDRTDAEGNFEFLFDEVLASSPTEVHVDHWWGHKEEIDLGGRSIELLNIPGHTQESVAIIDRERKYLFTGDYMYNGTLFAFLPGSDLAAYKASAEFILAEIDSSYTIFGAHSTPRNAYTKFQKLINLLDCIEDDSCTPTVFNSWGYVVYSYSLDGMTIWAYE